MGWYSANNGLGGTQQAMSSTYKSALSLNASNTTALRRGQIFDMLVGTNGTPADNYVEWDLSQITAAGTGTAVTPVKQDQADAAALTVATANYTAEPTVTATSSQWYMGINQRASYRWVADPNDRLVFPATNLAGYTLRARSGGYTGTFTATLRFIEY